MSNSRWLASCCVLGSIVIGAVLWATPNDAPTNDDAKATANKQDAKAENNKAFHTELLKIAADYRTYGRVDDETRWAPWLCRMPMPALARFSKSDEAETHGEKLYYIFAKDRMAYISIADGAIPKTGQVVVKESWRPKETTRKLSSKLWKDTVRDPIVKKKRGVPSGAAKPKAKPTLAGSFYPYAKKGDKTYHADKLAGLYIMYKTDTKTPDTDQGWVYGTVTADGKTVTSSGRVVSCMNCHEEAPYGRLFGMKVN